LILHTCPSCQTPCLYTGELGQEVSCRSCGSRFTLDRANRTDKDRVTRFFESARLKAEAARSSRRLVIAGAVVLGLVMCWFGASVFGLIPDEWRMLNRRFASVTNESSLSKVVGLIAVGRQDAKKGAVFEAYFSAVAISNDGFMLTSKGVSDKSVLKRVWLFLDERRLEAEVVGADSIADFAVIKVDAELELRFPLAKPNAITRYNIPVVAVGHDAVSDVSSPMDWPLAITRGTISRVFTDDLGTRWVEHSAAVGKHGQGGPLILNDEIIGINTAPSGNLNRAIEIGGYRERINRMIEGWREKPASGG